MIIQYIPVFLVFLAAAGFAGATVFSSEIFGPKRPSKEKLSTYESGMEPVRSARERFSVKYYMVAVLFILFDIEVIFLYPWAVNFRTLGVFGYVEMVIFIVILFVGYFYILRKGALRWD